MPGSTAVPTPSPYRSSSTLVMKSGAATLRPRCRAAPITSAPASRGPEATGGAEAPVPSVWRSTSPVDGSYAATRASAKPLPAVSTCIVTGRAAPTHA